MLLIKQGLEAFATPLALALVLSSIGAVLYLSGGARAARRLWIAAALVAYLGSSPAVGNLLLTPLESAYPPLAEHPQVPSIASVVVLGSGYLPRDHIPVTGALDQIGVVRIVEGIRLMRQLGARRLIVSGGAPHGRSPPARGYAALAQQLGISPASLVLLDNSLDTAAEARAVARLLRNEPFALVTSASHMPRAMRSMERSGAHPTAAPTGQLAEGVAFEARDLLPSARGLTATETAVHEYLGMAAAMVGIH
jgi:uncharacterized SAM-binding protein YcdF (DUF218 family)